MLEVVISIPAILLLIVLALGCYLLGLVRAAGAAARALAQVAERVVFILYMFVLHLIPYSVS
jgi:hypothetical protein